MYAWKYTGSYLEGPRYCLSARSPAWRMNGLSTSSLKTGYLQTFRFEFFVRETSE